MLKKMTMLYVRKHYYLLHINFFALNYSDFVWTLELKLLAASSKHNCIHQKSRKKRSEFLPKLVLHQNKYYTVTNSRHVLFKSIKTSSRYLEKRIFLKILAPQEQRNQTFFLGKCWILWPPFPKITVVLS